MRRFVVVEGESFLVLRTQRGGSLEGDLSCGWEEEGR
jgi:hypothetical protein